MPIKTVPEAHPDPCTSGTISFQRVKESGNGADHRNPFSAEVANGLVL